MNRQIPFFQSFALLLLGLLSLSSQIQAQKFKTDDPVKYNEYIIGKQNEIGEQMIGFMKNLKVVERAEMEKKVVKMIAVADAAEKAVRNLDPFDGNKEFRDRAADLFAFYKLVIEKDYPEIIDMIYAETVTEEHKTRMNEIFTKIQSQEAELDKSFSAAQVAFAEKHEIKLGDNEFQKKLEEETGGDEN